jgi:hypothetical protein
MERAVVDRGTLSPREASRAEKLRLGARERLGSFRELRF